MDGVPGGEVFVYGFTLSLILFGLFPSNCSHLGGIIRYDWIQKPPAINKCFPVPRPGLEPGWTYMSEGF